MNNWNEPAADAAVAGLARTAGANELFEIFCRFGARDFRSIGHKAIFVANAWRTLSCIGWHHAEPVLRSLAYALLAHEDGNPATRDAAPDRPWRRNQELISRIRAEWPVGKISSQATTDILAALRQGSNDDACDKVVEVLNRGISPQSVWDALLAGAGELLMRQPGIVALHAVTTTNALHYAFQASGSDETRRLLLLQNAAFLPMFREAMKSRGHVGDVHIDQLSGGDEKEIDVAEIFTTVSQDRMSAAQKTLTYLKQQPQPKELIDAARVLIFLKGRDSHDYKFSSAVLEDYRHATAEWRDRFLAASMFHLRGAGERDNGLVKRTRAALAT